jgi:YidC/Oxa1 family membrane protein insertase
MSFIWNTLLITPILNILVAFYTLTGNLGVAIILLTLTIRGILTPTMVPSLKAAQKQRDLQPELNKIKQKYKNDKQKQAQMQMELFKKHGVNPGTGCLTQLISLVVIFALYGVIRQFTGNADISLINSQIYIDALRFAQDAQINTNFLWMDLSRPDQYFILAVLAGALQFLQGKMTMPYVKEGEKAAEKTPDKTDDIAYNMQQQMMFTMPIMNFVIGLTLPSGVVLYIVTTTLFSLVQTYWVSGWGGLKPWIRNLRSKIIKING